LSDPRPIQADWRELVAEWYRWSGDFPVRTSTLYDRIATFLDGWQFPETPRIASRWVKFGMALKTRRDTEIAGLTLRSGLWHTKPVWWLEVTDPSQLSAALLVPVPVDGGVFTERAAEGFTRLFGEPPTREAVERVFGRAAREPYDRAAAIRTARQGCS
jgi:hypothetical protein